MANYKDGDLSHTKYEFSQELRDLLRPGKAVRLFYNEGNPNNEIRHIRAVVDDEFIVYRVWTPRRKWMYYITGYYGFLLAYRDGDLRAYRSRRKKV